MRHVLHNLFLLLILAGALNADSFSLKGRVIEILPDVRSLKVELTESTNPDMAVGEMHDFRVGAGDLEIGYLGSLIKAEAVYYSNAWHLERVFPLDGVGAKAMKDINRQLHDLTASMNRREYLREGDYVPNFAMIDQHGNFLQIRELRGNAFVLNFIFTRCKVATMCPASTTRMSKLQDVSSEASLENVRFVTVTFDPEFDSPGIMRSYGKNYSLDNENFHLLTSTQETVDDLLRLFGILTVEEDGTINHTMATLLIDANGRIAFRKEGSKWTVDEFLKEIEEL
ncbi:MAG: protein SCO1/2 [Lentimonas sp.]|jgi:protein SCO1/2